MAPYRLKVYLVENRRVGGKVKQETIAFLGSIDATWLPSFYADLEPADADKIRREDWQLQSLRERVAFWKGVNQRRKRLDNRLGPDAKRLRIAVHKRVPWPMEPERELLEKLEAGHDLKFWLSMANHTSKGIARTEEAIERANKELAELRQESVKRAEIVLTASSRLARLSKTAEAPGGTV